jgi:hypothetical protein
MCSRYLPLFPTEFLQNAKLRLTAKPALDVVHMSAIFLTVPSHNIAMVGKAKFLPVLFRVILVVFILLNPIITTRLLYHTPKIT